MINIILFSANLIGVGFNWGLAAAAYNERYPVWPFLLISVVTIFGAAVTFPF